MEIVAIELRVLWAIIERYELIKREIAELYNLPDLQRLQKYYDSADVCRLLNISKRTLHWYRDDGKIAFTRIQDKIYFRPCDIEKFINKTQSQTSKNGRLSRIFLRIE